MRPTGTTSTFAPDRIRMRSRRAPGCRALATTRETGAGSARASRPRASSSASAKRAALKGFSR